MSSSCPIIIGQPIHVKRNTDCNYRHTDKMEKKGRTAFGERLVTARKHAQLTQIAAAKAAGMSQGTLAELENDGHGSSYTAQLASLYGVNPTWLATGKGRMLSEGENHEPVVLAMAKQNHPDKTADDILELVQAYRGALPEERHGLMTSARALLALAAKRAVKAK